ncbi:KAT8 regulatory NSL complex subunit 3-like isoform X2 [Photinus pyralis]|nr:KAT8 regulatory NSL complex subunit 3-like isoform X2 [Photinus pyralis]
MDHCYARPLNWTAESSFFQPTKVLFMTPEELNLIKSKNPLAPQLTDDTDDLIDVESVPADLPEQYDKEKGISLMEECNRHASYARSDDGNDNWEDTISKTNWTFSQNLLFNGMVKILNSDRLARLAHTSAYHEPILRRIAIDKAVKRVRYLFATVSWNSRLTQWLHQLLLDNLTTSYLGAYFDILQTLKSKLPVFVDKMMFGPNANSRVGATSNESLFHLLKRPWDPFVSSLVQTRPRKLPGNPIVVIVPSSPSISNPNQLKRQHKWITLLSNLCTVVAVHTNMGN